MIDLHMHTNYSDGEKTVEELLKLCEEKKLEYISITDHDNCRQYDDDAIKCNKYFSGKIIKGVEMHALYDNRSYEILAYDIDTEIINEWHKKYYSDEKLTEKQKICGKMMLEIFDRLGIVYNLENIKWPTKPTQFVERPIFNEAISHLENRKIFGEYNETNFGLFFRKEMTNPESQFYMKPVGIPEHREVVDIIHKAGGKAFLAHPFEYKFEDTLGFIDKIRKEAELDGIEVFHPSAMFDNKKDILYEYARKNNLFICGGSDYHGKTKADIMVGVGRGNLNISKEFLLEWHK